jgi:predicted dehydrogenase
MKIAVVGCGHWGKNLVRNFYELGVLAMVCDQNAASLDYVKNHHPRVEITDSFDDLINRDDIDGLVIATPSSTHYKLAKRALIAGKNVYVEKPLAQNLNEAEELHHLAEERDLVLMVGHLLLYHPAVNKLKSLISSGELGEIKYINSDRRNFNRNQRRDSNVMWDLAPHDLSVMSYLISSEPEEILSVRAWASVDEVVDVVHIDLVFPHNIGAHIHNSWLDPQKQALLTVNGSKKTAVLNDTFKDNKLEIYCRNVDGSLTVEKPVYSNDEPLRLECKHFLDCIENKARPMSDGMNGSQVVKYLEQCQEMMSVGHLSAV